MIYGYIFAGIIFLLALWALGSYLVVKNIEKPTYQIVAKTDQYEIRRYQPVLLASTDVSGDYQEATTAGFKIIADYIFGNNTAAASIAMTSPVLEESAGTGIAMTSPVLEEPAENGLRRITFVLPSKYTLETIPQPNDTRVQLTEQPARTVAALSFTWYPTASRVQNKKQELLTALQKAGIVPQGEVQVARYNPPLSMPLVLQNEVMVTIPDQVN